VTNPVVFLLTGAEAEGSAIPEVVPVESQAPETKELLEEPPSRWRYPAEKPPRWLE
jgi:hypothetical protein